VQRQVVKYAQDPSRGLGFRVTKSLRQKGRSAGRPPLWAHSSVG
jgi:hypothetical protein